jgi:GNAT superfamily N-acetyltransferase
MLGNPRVARLNDVAPGVLIDHLQEWLGGWPKEAGSGIEVVSSRKRVVPGWDGSVHDFVGVATPERGVLSVPETATEIVGKIVYGHTVSSAIEQLRLHAYDLEVALGHNATLGVGVFRWTNAPVAMPSVGEWVPVDDPRVPQWLRPFNGEVLIAWDALGNYGAGVGRKMHDRFGQEISVGTSEALQGQGFARRLVTTAAQKIIAEGAIPTYVHDLDNLASAKVADASGFPDRGWRLLGLWG